MTKGCCRLFSYRTVVLILAKKFAKFPKKSLVRPNNKSSICERFQSTSYKTNSLETGNIFQLDHRYIITYENIRGKIRSDIKLNM